MHKIVFFFILSLIYSISARVTPPIDIHTISATLNLPISYNIIMSIYTGLVNFVHLYLNAYLKLLSRNTTPDADPLCSAIILIIIPRLLLLFHTLLESLVIILFFYRSSFA